MNASNSLPQGYEWLVSPHLFQYSGESGLVCKCAVSVAVERGGRANQVYVLCSELKRNWGTTIMNAWGPSTALELQLQGHIYAEAGDKLEQPVEAVLDGAHYHVSEEELEGWHFFEHHAPAKGENRPHVVPVKVPYEDLLYGPRVDLSGEGLSALLAAMTREVVASGFVLKELPT